MIRHSIHLIAIATLSLAAPWAQAREVQVGLNQSMGGNSNLVQGSPEPVPDGFYEIRPDILLTEDRETLNYRFYYGPQYNVYFKNNQVNGWNQYLSAILDYKMTQRDSVKLDAKVRQQDYVTTDQQFTGATPDVVAPGVGDVGFYSVDLGYTRSLSQRSSTGVSARYEQWQFTNPANTPNISGHGTADFQYLLNPAMHVGGNLKGTYRAFEERGARPRSSSTIVAANLLFQWRTTPSILIAGSGGPAWLRQRQDDPGPREVFLYNFRVLNGTAFAAPWQRSTPGDNCPGTEQLLFRCAVDEDPTAGDAVTNLGTSVFDTGLRSFAPGADTTSVDKDDVTYFADLMIQKDWGPFWRSSLQYTRTQDASGGLNATRIADTVTARVNWRPIDRTTLSVSGAFSNRVSDSIQTQGLPQAMADSLGQTTDNGNILAEAGDLVVVRFDQRLETRQVYVQVQASRQMTEHIQLRADFSYVDQWTQSRIDSTSSGGSYETSESRFTRMIGRLTLRYEFDAFRF